jgi:membrane protein DedA with SNARE-associated domain
VFSCFGGKIDAAMGNVNNFLTEYGLWAVIAGAFFEGQFLVFSAGIIAGHGFLHPFDVWIAATLGAWLGHAWWFYLGRFFKKRRLIWLIPGWKKNIRTVNRLIRKYPWSSLVFLQYVYGVRLVGAIAFGLTRISPPWFIGAQVVNCAAWASLLVLLGYFLGESLENGFLAAAKYNWIIFSILAVLYGIHRLVKREMEKIRNGKEDDSARIESEDQE